MIQRLETVLARLAGPSMEGAPVSLIDPGRWLDDDRVDQSTSAPAAPEAVLAAAFLAHMAGPGHPWFERATAVLADPPLGSSDEVVAFLRRGRSLIRDEVDRVGADDPAFAETLVRTSDRLEDPALGTADLTEACWGLFFPEAAGILGHEAAREAGLRSVRTVNIRALAKNPLTDPGREILFTSNVLLTLPAASEAIEDLPYPARVVEAIRDAVSSPQRYWYDHPIQIGVAPEGNELLYGVAHARRRDRFRAADCRPGGLASGGTGGPPTCGMPAVGLGHP